MRGIYLFLVILVQIISCAAPPQIPPINQSGPSISTQSCTAPFPRNKWDFVHSIEATMPKGKKAVFIGVTALSPETGTIHCVIMTLEGLVLFDAQYNHKMVINRGIPPFDSVDFARGLLNDIKLIFFPPEGQLIQSGIAEDGSSICRYKTDSGKIVDVIGRNKNLWEIRQYNDNSDLSRSVRAYPDSKRAVKKQEAIPGRLVLTAYGSPGYSLILELIEARESR